MAKLITIYWRDIPAQVMGRKGRTTAFKRVLGPRFQRAIDRAAMRAGRGSSDHYLDDWRREVSPVQDSVTLLLSLIRNSAEPSEERGDNGFFQRTLPSNMVAQLVRVGIPSAGGIYAEISGGKHRFSIRFMDCADWQHPTQVDREVPFTLSTCMM